MEIENALKLIGQDENYRVIKKVNLPDVGAIENKRLDEPCGLVAIIDTETTGFNPDLGARIIDIAIAKCEYGLSSGRIYRIVDRYESLEDPGEPLSKEVAELTGISDQMLKGQFIEEAGIAKVMEGVSLVVCHNAVFDRSFLESRFPVFADHNFACSLDEIPWAEWGIPSAKLDYLGFKFGMFHIGHRARADVDMLLSLLVQETPDKSKNILSVLLESARQPSWMIYAVDLPYDSKDHAKIRGYRWNDGKLRNPKSWYIHTRDLVSEEEFLTNYGCKQPLIMKLTAKSRYRSVVSRMLD